MIKQLDPVFSRFVNQVGAIDQILHYSIEGIAGWRSMPGVVKAIAGWREVTNAPHSPDEYARSLENAETRAAFAESQIKEGFSIPCAHATVAMWAAVEALVEDILVIDFHHAPAFMATDGVRQIKIPLYEYEQLTPEERLRFVVKELIRKSSADLKPGVGRFEILLGFVNLSGPVTEAIRKTLVEFWAVRNVIVHRAGLADRRLVEFCPWLGIKLGDPLRISHAAYSKYRNGAFEYFTELLIRDLVRRGSSREEAERRILESTNSGSVE